MGTVEQIETGVVAVVKRGEMAKRAVLLVLGETHITVHCGQTYAVLLRFEGFCFIANGETTRPTTFSHLRKLLGKNESQSILPD